MCDNDKTTPMERDEEIEVLVIEGGWKENYKFFHACKQLHHVLL
jgi:DTW domain-containing protein YfiP